MDIATQIAQELNIRHKQVEASIALLDEGNTVPFIARYRKEMTGTLDDEILRRLEERLTYLRNLEKRKTEVLHLLQENDIQEEGLFEKISQATTLVEVEDYYRPHRPKRKTRASEAKRRGLEALADLMLVTLEGDKKTLVENFVNPEKEVETYEDAVQGAMDILAERFTDDPEIRKKARKMIMTQGTIYSNNKVPEEERTPYEMYYTYAEKIAKVAPHRMLALNRGEKENVLQVGFEFPDLQIMESILKKNLKQKVLFLREVKESILDGYKRLLVPSLQREIRNMLSATAEEHAIGVFAANARKLLLQSPIKDSSVVGFDPAFRTGCKLACVDATGKVLDTGVIYPTEPNNKIESSRKKLASMLEKHQAKTISLGNGTACRESETFLMEMIQDMDLDVLYTITNEAGASVYSASKLGQQEFPDLDVTLRSAVSIARRIIDPLAELVKIDPKAIGVGQYQHDVDQKRLAVSLDGVVEDCVNLVGVNLNTASVPLLLRVSGLSKKTAENIVAYREEKGLFSNRKEVLKVKGVGPKAYEQAAGFLRIPDGENPLDNTAVHPESYEATKALLDQNEIELGDEQALKALDIEAQAEALDIGVPTLKDIVQELLKPGRDPREELPKPVFKSGVIDLKDLKPGMELEGVIRNVVDFGAFVDIGVHQDGLVHISELSDHFVRNALEHVSVGDQVKVRVLSIDIARERVSLSMKGMK